MIIHIIRYVEMCNYSKLNDMALFMAIKIKNKCSDDIKELTTHLFIKWLTKLLTKKQFHNIIFIMNPLFFFYFIQQHEHIYHFFYLYH